MSVVMQQGEVAMAKKKEAKKRVEFTPPISSGPMLVDKAVKSVVDQHGWPDVLAALIAIAKHSNMNRTANRLLKLYSRMLRRQSKAKDRD